MCGIFGFDRTTESTALMTPLLAAYMNERGRESWGVTDGDFIYKSTGSIMEGWGDFSLEAPVYHCRAASVGNISTRNAHPFEFIHEDKRIIGLHNGHITNHSDLEKKYNHQDNQVDSESIFQLIVEGHGVEEIDGWGAVVWYEGLKDDPESMTQYMSRFGHGDNLHVSKLDDGSFVFASTEMAIDRAARFASRKIDKSYLIKDNKRYGIEDGELRDMGEMPWKKNALNTWGKKSNDGSTSSHTHGSTYRGAWVGVFCASEGCSKEVKDDALICTGCYDKLKLDYYGGWTE